MSVPTVVCVLRGGGEYTPAHVVALHEGVRRHWPKRLPLCFRVLTDTVVGRSGIQEERLRYGWPGWWSKMELFRPEFSEDFLYLDLDTVVVGDLTDILLTPQLTLLRDFYHRDMAARWNWMGSGVMLLPRVVRGMVWDRWMANPGRHIRGNRGDQDFLMTCWSTLLVQRWQDVLPGQVISYKVHVRPANAVPPAARVVCYHGKPRPWQAPLPGVA